MYNGEVSIMKCKQEQIQDKTTITKNFVRKTLRAAVVGFSLLVAPAMSYAKPITQHTVAAKKILNTPRVQKKLNADLLDAAFSGDVQDVKQLIKKGANVNAKSEHGRTTPLMEASSEGYTEVAELLIKKGANVNAKSEHGWTPLMEAASGGHIETAELLIKKGANVNYKAPELCEIGDDNPNGHTVLMMAHGSKKMIELLIKNGANVNAKGLNGYTLLMQLSEDSDKKEIIEMIIKNGANVNARDKYGQTALMTAAHHNSDAVELLIKNGADVNARTPEGRTALMMALDTYYGSNSDAAHVLRKHGAKE